MTEPMRCKCDRPIPIAAAWKALTLDKPLRCSRCGFEQGRETLLLLVDDEAADDRVRSALIAWAQIVRYGWTSSSSIANMMSTLDAKVIGGVLAGLVRAGILQRAGSAPSPAGAIADPHPIFIPGPTHQQAVR